MQRIRARADDGIHERARAPPEFGGVGVGLNLELLEGFYGGLDHLHIESAKTIRV